MICSQQSNRPLSRHSHAINKGPMSISETLQTCSRHGYSSKQLPHHWLGCISRVTQCRWPDVTPPPSPAGWVTSSIRRPLSSAAATMPVCVQNAASACHSWTHKPAWPRTTATSGWSDTTAALVGKQTHIHNTLTHRLAGTIYRHNHSISLNLRIQKQSSWFVFLLDFVPKKLVFLHIENMICQLENLCIPSFIILHTWLNSKKLRPWN